MNFFGHAVVASEIDDRPGFVLGAMLPDFATMAGGRLDGVKDTDAADGLHLHHRTDEIFHELPVVRRGMRALAADLTAAGLARGPARAAGHVGFELLLDGVLIRKHGVPSAYERALEHLAVGPDLAAWRRAPQRWDGLVSRLTSGAIPAGYRDPAFVADRILYILRSRRRLRVDADAATEPVHAAMRAHLRAVEAVAEEVMWRIREDAADAMKDASAGF